MRKYVLILFVLSTLIAAKCNKDKECHSSITCINKSNDTIIWAMKTLYASSNLCKLEGTALVYNQSKTYDVRYCWEDEFYNNKKLEFFIVNPNKYNNDTVFYSCDSLEFKNNILKHYILDLEDLQRMNWTVTYP
jgi:hypothetical protein